MSRHTTKQTNWHVRPAKTQISLGIRPVWSESSLSAWRKLGSLATHWAHSEDSDQTGRMPRLILIFAGQTVTFVGFVISRLKWFIRNLLPLFCCSGKPILHIAVLWVNPGLVAKLIWNYFLKNVCRCNLERFSTIADEFRSRCQTFRENTTLTAFICTFTHFCTYLKSRVHGNRISIMVCFVFRRLWQWCWKWRFMKNLQEVRNVADWKWISGEIEMQQH